MQTHFLSRPTLLFIVVIAAFIACNKSDENISSPAQNIITYGGHKLDDSTALGDSATFGKVYLLTESDYNIVEAKAGGVPDNYQQLYLCDTSTQYTVDEILLGISSAFSGEWFPYAFAKDTHSHIFVLVKEECNMDVDSTISKYTDWIVADSPYKQQKNPHKIGQASIAIIFTPQLK